MAPSKSPEELAVGAALECGPRLEAALRVKLVGEIDIGLAVQQVAQVDPGALQVDRIDLEIAPIQRSVGVIVINLAGAARIFGALHGERDAAVRSEFIAGVLLVSRQPAAELIHLRGA